MSKRQRVSVADIQTFYAIVLKWTYKAQCSVLLRITDASPRKLVNQHGFTEMLIQIWEAVKLHSASVQPRALS